MKAWWRRHHVLISYIWMLAGSAVIVMFLTDGWPERVITWLVLNVPIALWLSRKGF